MLRSVAMECRLLHLRHVVLGNIPLTSVILAPWLRRWTFLRSWLPQSACCPRFVIRVWLKLSTSWTPATDITNFSTSILGFGLGQRWAPALASISLFFSGR